MRDDVPSNEIVTRFRRAFDGGWYGSVPASQRRRVDLSSLGVGLVTALYLLVDGQGWVALPAGLIFFTAARMFAFDASVIVSAPLRALRWVMQSRSNQATQPFSDELMNAFLTPDDIGPGWTQSPPRRETGAIIVPCSRFGLFDDMSLSECATVEFSLAVGDSSERVRQTVAIVTSTEVAMREFATAKAAFGCSRWFLPDQTYDVERLELPTGEVEAIMFRLESHSSPRTPGPPLMIHGVVVQHGRVVVDVDHYLRAEPPDLDLTRSIVSRAVAKATRLANAVRDEELPTNSPPLAPGHADLDPFFPTDDLPENFILSMRQEPSADQESTGPYHITTFSMSSGFLRGEQRVYRANADFYTLEITAARFTATDEASTALKQDAGEYLKRDHYGVRSVRLPVIGDESSAAAGRASIGHRGSRVACVWVRRGTVVTRFQGFTLASDPLPVVQTLAEHVAKQAG